MKNSKVNQVANFEKLVSLAGTLGAAYNPDKSSLQVTALYALQKQTTTAMVAAMQLNHAYNEARHERDAIANGIPRLASRITAVLRANGVSEELLVPVIRIKRRFGTRAKRIVEQEGATNNSPPTQGVESQRRTRSYLDMPSMIGNFSALVFMANSFEEYITNEPDLTHEALNQHANLFRISHDKVVRAHQAWRSAEDHVNELLYDTAGIYGTSKTVKAYIESKYGFGAPVHRIATSIHFTKR
jgi:hypothetical protein